MAEEAGKKKVNKGLIAGICIAVVAAIAAVVTVVIINVTKPNIVGKYTMTSILDSDGNESSDAFELFKAFGANYEIEFKEDKTGVFKISIDSSKMGSLVSSFANALTGALTDENGDIITNETSDTSATGDDGDIIDININDAGDAASIDLGSLTSSDDTTTDVKVDATTTTTTTENAITTGLSDTSVDFAYDDKKIKFTASTLGSTELDYEFKDGAIIVDYFGQKMKFTKAE